MEPDLFSQQQPVQPRRNVGMPPQELQRVTENVNHVGSRLAVLEERMGNIRKKTQLTEKSLLDYERETKADLKSLIQTVTELTASIEEMKEQIDSISGELANVVKRHEFTVLERYLDLWEPVNFVTRDEAKMLLKDRPG